MSLLAKGLEKTFTGPSGGSHGSGPATSVLHSQGITPGFLATTSMVLGGRKSGATIQMPHFWLQARLPVV
jgi:hypothetical protein